MITVNGRQVLETMEELVDPQHTALVIVDVQKDFCYPGGWVDKQGGNFKTAAGILPAITRAVSTAREVGALLVYVQQSVPPRHLWHSGAWIRHYTQGLKIAPDLYGCVENTWGWEIADEIKPREKDIVIRKTRSSSFVGTPLVQILRVYKIKTVIVCGYTTNTCVAVTLRDALWYDFYSVALLDCMQSSDVESHEIWMNFFRKRGDHITVDELRKIWKGDSTKN
jgi:ureidoacrylate peracid hydrolase